MDRAEVEEGTPPGSPSVVSRRAKRLAWTLWLIGLATLAGSLVFSLAQGEAYDWSQLSEEVAFVAVGLVGLVVATHQSRNPIGWIYLSVWVAAAGVFGLVQEYAHWVAAFHPGAIGGAAAAWLTNWLWVPIFTVLLTYPFLLFPDGRLPSPRWRWLAWAIPVVTALWSVAFAFEGADYTDALNRPAPNPFAPAAMIGFFDAARVVLSFVVLATMGACVSSLFVRYRRARGDEREQLRWLMLAASLTVVWLLLPVQHGEGGPTDLIQGFFIALIPLAIGVAILKYRLYDIDLVIRRTVVFGLLAAFVSVVYVAIVVGVGTAIGSRGSPVLSGLAAALVALAFQPVRRWGRRVANRLVYGKRATPYEAMSELASRLGEAYDPEQVLPQMARVLADGTGARQAEIWLQVVDRLHVAAVWPPGAEPRSDVPADPMPESIVPIRHGDDLLGGMSIEKPVGDPLTPTESKLVADLARQAGLVLRNVRLTEQLRARLEDLRASRQRLVTAQDDERRRIERNIHDGAQQQLVALQVKLGLARRLNESGSEPANELLEQLQSDTQQALEDLRDLARGIYPPLLADQGLAAALEAQARRSPVPVTVQATAINRYPPEVEAAVYFSVLEALQNVSKYARATHATVRLTNGSQALAFEVTDDGIGFDPDATGYGTGLQGIEDRLASLGGALVVRSMRGAGTTLAGSVPAQALA